MLLLEASNRMGLRNSFAVRMNLSCSTAALITPLRLRPQVTQPTVAALSKTRAAKIYHKGASQHGRVTRRLDRGRVSRLLAPAHARRLGREAGCATRPPRTRLSCPARRPCCVFAPTLWSSLLLCGQIRLYGQSPSNRKGLTHGTHLLYILVYGIRLSYADTRKAIYD